MSKKITEEAMALLFLPDEGGSTPGAHPPGERPSLLFFIFFISDNFE